MVDLVTSVVVATEVLAVRFDFRAFQYFLIMSETRS